MDSRAKNGTERPHHIQQETGQQEDGETLSNHLDIKDKFCLRIGRKQHICRIE